MIDPDRRQLEQTIRIDARPETVWRFWTDPERICAWWGRSAELDPRAGGPCIVDLGGGAVMRGEYLELVPHERIVFSFGWDPHPDGPDIAPGSSRVEITLVADGAATILTLRHYDVPAGESDRHDAGWAHFLARLATSARPTDQEA